MNLNYCLFAIAKIYSRIVLRKLTNENSAIFRTVVRNYKKLIFIGRSNADFTNHYLTLIFIIIQLLFIFLKLLFIIISLLLLFNNYINIYRPSNAGFTLVILDSEEIEVRYPSLFEVVGDLRGMGESCANLNRKLRVQKDTLCAAAAIYQGI